MSRAGSDQPIAVGSQGMTVPYLAHGRVTRVAYHLECWLRSLGIDHPG